MKSTRGAKGGGSIRKRPDGLWEGRFTLPGGKRLSVYGATKSETAEALRQTQLDHASGKVATTGRLTVREYLDSWIAQSVEGKLRATTIAGYRSIVKRYFGATVEKPKVEGIGAHSLRNLSPRDVEAFYSRLRRAGVGDRTTLKCHATLRRALGAAVRSEILPRNVAALCDPPRYRAPEIQAFTREQMQIFFAAARGQRLVALFIVAATTGARQGELFAVRWRNVDLTRGALDVKETIAEVDGEWVRGAPKTERSRRRIPLAAAALDALAAHQERMKAEGQRIDDEALVFPDRSGGPLRRQNVLRRDFYPLLAEAKLPRITFHGLRHSFATLAGELGATPRAVADILGHSTPSITLNIYSHAFETAQRAVTDAVGAALDEMLPHKPHTKLTPYNTPANPLKGYIRGSNSTSQDLD